MKMVAAARLRRAQDRVLAARPYVRMLSDLLSNVAAAADERIASHPLLVHRPERRILLVLMTSDRGLAGAFNANLIKGAQQFLAEHASADMEMFLYGRKGRDFFRKRGARVAGEIIGTTQTASYEHAASLAQMLMQKYSDEEIDGAYLIYNEFKSVVAQKLNLERILPLRLPEHAAPVDYIYEQPPEQLLASLLPRHFEAEVYRAMLETAAAEHAARMTAMDAASSNADEMIEKLTLYMNRVRQASITREIIEVVSGANALE